MYSTYDEGKSVAPERFIRTLKNKIYKYMISVSKNMYMGKLDDIGNKYNNTYKRSIKRKLVDVKSNTYNGSSKEINDKDPKFEISCIIRTWKYKNIFAKVIVQIGGKKFLWLKKLKIQCRWHRILW